MSRYSYPYQTFENDEDANSYEVGERKDEKRCGQSRQNKLNFYHRGDDLNPVCNCAKERSNDYSWNKLRGEHNARPKG